MDEFHDLFQFFLIKSLFLSQCESFEKISGFLATILKRLAENEISCNVVSGFYHDHLFVSDGEEVKVMNILRELST